MPRIIICGPSTSGKTFFRSKLESKGFKFDVSYTSREPRPNEIDNVHYKFLTKEQFENKIKRDELYEYVNYNGNYYGTGLFEWFNTDCFIMETDGISKIKPEDRKESVIIYLNPPIETRIKRMKERNWSEDEIKNRLQTDKEKFENFIDYDIIIKDPNF